MFLTRFFNRRKYRTLLILSLIAVIFYFLQFFSLRKLNFWNERREKIKNIHELSEIDNEERFRQELKIAEDKIKKDEENSNFLLNGVHLKHLRLYRADINGSFTCLVDKVKISFTQVNDDFCDCKDSSDEPGTNACPHSKFYCKYQIPEDDPVFIAGSKVNDGICDCCDGSDEWTNHRVPSNIQIHDKLFLKKYSVYQTPCENHCQKGLQIRAQEERVRRIGLKLKENYLLAAKNIGSGTIYGPRNVFYKLSMTCYSIEKTIYEYTICPFKSVTQVDFPQATFNLGKTPEWKKQEKGDYSLLMKNGDNRLCPDGMGRNTLIRFFCGLQDQPLSIKEESKCSYLVIFTTPAAC